MELIISPGIVFLDEPTTGLDAGTAVSVVRLLKEYVEVWCGVGLVLSHEDVGAPTLTV